MKKMLSYLGMAGILCGLALPVVQAQTYELETVWEKHPADFPQFFATNHTVRGMGYNPVTNHLLIASRNDNAVHRVDAADGTYIGELDMTGVAGGLFIINKVAVASDGAIYVGNLTTDSTGASAYHLYRWADEEAVPVRVYAGNPGDVAPDNRWGDAMDVRGAGADTEILLGSYNGSMLSVLRPGSEDPSAPDSYTVQSILTEVEAMSPRNVTFGPGDVVYLTRPTGSLYELEIDFDAGTVLNQRAFDGSKIAAGLSPLGYGADVDVIAGILTGSHEIWVYRRTHLSLQWTALPIATKAFSFPDGESYIANSNSTGDVIVVGDTIYGLDTNNSILAAKLVESDPPPPLPAAEIFWSNNDAIRGSMLDGSEPRTVIGGLLRPIGLAIDAEAGHIYWAEDGVGRIARANLDGSEPTAVVEGLATPQDVLLLNGRIYFTQYSLGLFSVDMNGGDLQPVIEVAGEGTSPIAYNETTGKIFMSAVSAGKLYSVNPNGSDLETITDFGTNFYGISFDSGGTLFRTRFGTTGVIETYNVNTGTTQSLFETARANPLGIDVSPDDSRIYWAERTGGNVFAVNADGSGEVLTLATGENSPFGVALMPSATSGEGFADWIASFDVPVEQRGAEDDPDGDGIDNLLEYGLGGNPSVANRDILPVIGVQAGAGGEYLAISYGKNASATGIDYIVEVSGDLVDWVSRSGETEIVSEDGDSAIVRDATPMTEADRRFIRLRVIEQ